MNPRLKEIVFKKLNQDLSKVEIIVAENKSIWFINRANKHWYFELEKSGKLWWRYEFFIDFFPFFCLEVNEFQPLLSEWVEGILNRGVSATYAGLLPFLIPVEGILNRGVSSTRLWAYWEKTGVEDILNCGYRKGSRKVEDVLNCEINEIDGGELLDNNTLEKVLNHKIVSILPANLQNDFVQQVLVNELLIKIESATPLDTPATNSVDEVLNSIVPLEIP